MDTGKPDHAKLNSLGLGAVDNRFEKLTVLKKNPQANAVLSKLVRSMDSTGAAANINGTNQGADAPSAGYISRVSDATASNVTDTRNIYQMIPDTELAEKILVSSILSPKDMVTTELNYGMDETHLPPELTGPLLKLISDFFTKSYKIDSLLPTILSDILFHRGSYPMLIIPESSVDEIINHTSRVSMESLNQSRGDLFKRGIGILGDSRTTGGDGVPHRRGGISMEGFQESLSQNVSMIRPRILTKLSHGAKTFDTKVSVTDNPDVLKAPFIAQRIQRQAISDTFKARGFGMESHTEVSRDDIQNSFYKPRGFQPRPIVSVKTSDEIKKKTVGHPLVMRLPAESIIPVHVPGSPEEHVGYFVLLDMSGNPVNKANRSDYYNDLSVNMAASKDMSSQLLAQAQRATEGLGSLQDLSTIDQATRLYSELIEEDLIARLRNGVYNDNVQIARPLEVYRIMLARTFANMGTQLLYVPTELVSYMAFDYNNNGVGKSLLEDNKILASLRVMLMLANTMSAISNSVPHTGLNITLDPADPDPSTTVEKLVHNYVTTRQASYPLGASSPVDIVSFLQNAGVDVHVTGSPAYPETRMEVEDRARNVVAPSTELEESLKKRYLMSLGLSPETVDQSYSVEFATSVVTSNLLLTKRVMLYQDLFTVLLSEFIRKYTMNSGELLDKLRKVIEANIPEVAEVDGQKKDWNVDDVLQEFIGIINVSLPRPDSITLERQMEAYDKYVEALEKVIEAYFSSDFLEGTALGDQADQVDVTKAAMLAYFKRKWLRENNVMSELQDLTSFTEDNHPLIDLLVVHGDHVDSIGASLQGYMEHVALSKKKRAEAATKFEESTGAELGGGGGGTEPDDTEGSEEPDDDFGLDDDLDGAEEPDEEIPEEEEAPEEENTADPEADKDVSEETLSGSGDVIIQPHD